jgi:hypothetical protein
MAVNAVTLGDRPKGQIATLCDLFDHAVATAPDKLTLRHLDVALTYRELGRAVASMAAVLLHCNMR